MKKYYSLRSSPVKTGSYYSVLSHLFQPPRYLRFTNLGKAVVLFAFGIGLSAMNTGNNLLYMIFGMILGFITASGIISEMSLRGLEIDWILEQELYALKPAALRLILRNTKKKFPSFGIDVTVEISTPIQNGSPIENGARREKSENYFLGNRFLAIAAKSHEYADFNFVPMKRGAYLIKRVKIESCFPFGFFRKYFFRELNKAFIVYPQMVAVPLSAMRAAAQIESRPLSMKGAGDSFWGLKNFVEGDNPRLISWKNSAKSGKIVVRETERETEQKLWLCLEPLEKWMELNKAELESAVSFAASYGLKKLKMGNSIGLLSREICILPSKEKRTLSEILKFLALFEPQEGSSVAHPLRGGVNKGEFISPRGWGEEQVEILALWMQFRDVG